MKGHHRYMAMQYKLPGMTFMKDPLQQPPPFRENNQEINVIFFHEIEYTLISIIVGDEMILGI